MVQYMYMHIETTSSPAYTNFNNDNPDNNQIDLSLS